MEARDWERLVGGLDVGVVVQERDLRITFANARATALLGVTTDEVRARTTNDPRWDVVHVDGRPLAPDEHPGPLALATGRPVRDVVLGVRRGATDERVWILAAAIPQLDEGGEVERVIITFSDVTTTQRALRERDAIYRTMFQSVSEGLVIHNPDGSIRAANAAAERVLGLSMEQMSGRAATDARWRLVDEHSEPIDPRAIPSEIAIRTGQPAERTTIGVHRTSGELAWLDVRADPLREVGDPTLRGVVATFTDVTEPRRITQDLATSRTQLQRVLDAVPGVVYQYLAADGPGRVTFLAGRIREVLGLDDDALRRNPDSIFALVDEAEVRELDRRIQEAVRARAMFVHELPIRNADGVRWLRLQGLPEDTADGLLYTGFMVDVTEARRLAEALRGSQRREAMGEVAAGVAYNFNNMLAVILPNVELARLAPEPERQALLADAEHAARRASDLVRRMLALGSAPAGDRLGRVDLAVAVREAVHICRQTFDRGIAIDLDLQVVRAPVRGEAAAIEQLLLNMCLNARDAVRGVARPRLELRLEPEATAGWVQLRVADNGHGMDATTVRRIGEPFFTTKGPGRGSGLGLATAFQTVRDASGTWQVDSTPGAGTTFTMRFPVGAAAPEPAEAAPQPAPAFPRGHLLVIDDEAMVRKALARQLGRTGLTVETADSAEAALARLTGAGIANLKGIVLDMSMPGMSGTQALPHLRAAAPGVPIILLSGHLPEGDRVAGADLVLTKPVATDELVRAVAALLA